MTQDAANPNLLNELESRQDELLRLLGELEERTKAALASLTAPPKPAIVVGTSSTESASPSKLATPIVETAAPATADASERKTTRARCRKAA